ncbi:hypothetical protein EJ05DRAFT_497099 [Pseudovirgaria hyperparasitica]|uniref:Uncharacterized protein n=1 Tax=Pseudovirgaria hyperparasitica TaxID=470096 RepID=A0A6A6WIT7_9PEZI|nr:uncharacterized protein EJ05DRAFT_497099 [Pseudovirgaria hyperparasitica]KAF2762239.1 hypothetical protein EJ05DRAFT_497099 [Pseudovirgaria hyperparasitica]
MRFSVACLVALPAVIYATVIPTSPDSQNHHVHSNGPARPEIINLELTHNHPKALFKVPCNGGCLGIEDEDDDALLFDFQAFPSKEPCGVANVTVNGHSLTQAWNGTHALGAGSVHSFPLSSLTPRHELGLSWHSSCVNESIANPHRAATAQVITVLLQSIDGKSIEQSSGFTISFKPLFPLELLRLSSTPDFAATEPQYAQYWRDPPAHLRLTSRPSPDLPSSENEENPSSATNTDPVQELRRLEAEALRINELIEQQKSLIQALRQDESNTSVDAPTCLGIKCTLNNIVSKAKDALEDIYMSIRIAPFQGIRPHQVAFEDHKPSSELLPSPTTDNTHHPSSTRSLTSADLLTSTSSTHSADDGQEWVPLLGDTPSDASGSSNIDPLSITLKIVGAVTGLTCIYICFRRSRCCNPRAQAERRAEQEERATQRAYRRAARKHRFQQWWAAWTGRQRDHQRITDYEEKRSLIRQQEVILESAMQDEIRMLRAAHDAVNSIFHTTTRASRHSPHATSSAVPIFPHSTRHNITPFERPYYHDSEEPWHRAPRSRTDSLPDYRSDAGSSQVITEPPAYSDDEGDLITNGFSGYRPRSGTLGSDDSTSLPSSPTAREHHHRRWTPGSSVVSTSPRPSQETMRYL